MAKKATTKTAAQAAHHELPPAMDYKAHEATWNGFIEVTKLSIIGLVILMVGLFCVLFFAQPVLGLILILLAFIVPIVIKIMSGRKLPAR